LTLKLSREALVVDVRRRKLAGFSKNLYSLARPGRFSNHDAFARLRSIHSFVIEPSHSFCDAVIPKSHAIGTLAFRTVESSTSALHPLPKTHSNTTTKDNTTTIPSTRNSQVSSRKLAALPLRPTQHAAFENVTSLVKISGVQNTSRTLTTLPLCATQDGASRTSPQSSRSRTTRASRTTTRTIPTSRSLLVMR